MIKELLYKRNINFLLRSILRPLSTFIPDRFKFPINGVFTVKGKGIPSFKMLTNETSAVTKYLFWGNVEGFEYHAIRIFCDLVGQAEVFFDIGSNIGYYSLLASSIRKGKLKVYAFEPMPSAYRYLSENIELNGFYNIVPVKLALSNQSGIGIFHSIENRKFPGIPQLTGDGSLNNDHSNNNSKVSFEVDIDTLDNFVAHNLQGNMIDLIKLDTEANEHKVLAGAHQVLMEHRPIIQCEILKNQIEKELQEIFVNYNYLFFRATNKGLVEVSSFSDNPTKYVDYYLVPFEKTYKVSKFVLADK